MWIKHFLYGLIRKEPKYKDIIGDIKGTRIIGKDELFNKFMKLKWEKGSCSRFKAFNNTDSFELSLTGDTTFLYHNDMMIKGYDHVASCVYNKLVNFKHDNFVKAVENIS